MESLKQFDIVSNLLLATPVMILVPSCIGLWSSLGQCRWCGDGRHGTWATVDQLYNLTQACIQIQVEIYGFMKYQQR